LISKAGILAGAGLFIIYTGLIVTGALYNGVFEPDVNRTQLLSGISMATLGNTGRFLLSVLVTLACFTTAVGIVTGASDFFKGISGGSGKVYLATAVISCISGIVIGQSDVGYIIAVAVPALLLIYPITIIMILLNVLPEKYTPPRVFKAVVYTTVAFSLPDFIAAIGYENAVNGIKNTIPLGNYSLGWLLPALLVFLIFNRIPKKKRNDIG
ncbi:MAG: branched-chain amino acid transport system II carrier protein, partial [Sinomicrobium sp.]|nr:branched-chain amino acid transport system II carrier protein [Sinomicrobium sp.]